MFDFLINKLRIKNNKLVGKIYNLEKKLNGKLPVTNEELIYLVNSWGISKSFYIEKADRSEPKECYDLSQLDTSQITNMFFIFAHSNFNGDISNWDVSNVTNMSYMFNEAMYFNSQLNNWDVSNVTDMSYMFYGATKFNQDISKWDVSNVLNMNGMFSNSYSFNQNISSWNLKNLINSYGVFYEAKAFNKKYNKNQEPLIYANQLKKWFNDNNVKMTEIDIKDNYSQELNNFFQDIYLLTECNKQSIACKKKKNLELKEKVILQEEKEENFVNVFNEFGFKIS